MYYASLITDIQEKRLLHHHCLVQALPISLILPCQIYFTHTIKCIFFTQCKVAQALGTLLFQMLIFEDIPGSSPIFYLLKKYSVFHFTFYSRNTKDPIHLLFHVCFEFFRFINLVILLWLQFIYVYKQIGRAHV